jgi:hypothetical protein
MSLPFSKVLLADKSIASRIDCQFSILDFGFWIVLLSFMLRRLLAQQILNHQLKIHEAQHPYCRVQSKIANLKSKID